MKKMLITAALLTVFSMLCPILAFPGQAKTETAADLLTPTLPEERLIAEAPPVLPAEESGEYDESVTVRLLRGGEVTVLTLREYLEGVLASEMPASFPEEALKAQAVAARTYTLYKMDLYASDPSGGAHKGAQMCDDPAHCAAYCDLSIDAVSLWGEGADAYGDRIRAAVAETDGMILTYEDAPIAAVFCAASCKTTESAKDVWGTDLPYLVPVDSPGGEDCSKYYGEVRVETEDFRRLFCKKYPEADLTGSVDTWFRSVVRTDSGSVRTIRVGGTEITGGELRSLLGLNSCNFSIQKDGNTLVFSTEGYGHGVGMSQYGARYYALSGKTYAEILAHYYPETKLIKRSTNA